MFTYNHVYTYVYTYILRKEGDIVCVWKTTPES